MNLISCTHAHMHTHTQTHTHPPPPPPPPPPPTQTDRQTDLYFHPSVTVPRDSTDEIVGARGERRDGNTVVHTGFSPLVQRSNREITAVKRLLCQLVWTNKQGDSLHTHKSVCQLINQFISQSINQSFNQSINYSVDQRVNLICQPLISVSMTKSMINLPDAESGSPPTQTGQSPLV